MNRPPQHFYEFDDFRLDPDRRLLLRGGEPIPLTPKAFDTLLVLVRRGGRVVGKDELLKEVWPDTFVEEATLAQNVFTLRKALGYGQPGRQYIETVPKHGYRFAAQVRESGGVGLFVERHTRTHIVTEEFEENDGQTYPGISGGLKASGSARSSASKILSGVKRHYRAAAATVLALALAAAALLLMWARTASRSEARAAAPFERMRLGALTADGKALRACISPDGKYVAHVLKDGGRESLWLRQVSATQSRQVIAPADAHFQGLTFSPRSDAIYYAVYEKENTVASLYRVPALEGEPVKVLSDLDSAVAFSPDGKRIAFVRNDPGSKEGSLIIANADGTGERKVAARSWPDFFSTEGPAWSPDGPRLVCAVGRNESNRITMRVLEVGVEDGAARILPGRAWDFIGQVAWLQDGSAVLMDAWDSSASLLSTQLWQLSTADGEARRVTNDLSSYWGVSLTADNKALVTVRTERAANFWVAPGTRFDRAERITSGAGDLVGEGMGVSWTPDGRIVYGSNAGGGVDVWVMDGDGSHAKQLTFDAQADYKPSVSPDGRFIVFVSQRAGASHLWRMDVDGASVKQLTDGAAESYPSVSPDGRWVVYLSAAQNNTTLWRVSTDGGTPVQLSDSWSMSPAVSPDQKLVACFSEDRAAPGLKLALIPFEGGAPVKLLDLPKTVFMRAGLHWTEGGRALAYVDNRDGVSNIWSRPVDGGPARQLTNFTSDKIFRLAWSRDGSRLAYERGMEINDVIRIGDLK
jgi:Tol biopolymer transport system component/DNA-binding winged helix-turn-helix (wHTH) protein